MIDSLEPRDPCEIVRLVRRHGVEKAREMAMSKHSRKLVEIAASVLADEQQAIGISYSGMCLTGLPYKRLADDQVWVKQGHKVTLLIEPGRLIIKGQPQQFGVPWGSRGRILLMHLMTQAIRTNNREVTMGKSARSTLARMGLEWSGETAKAVSNQISRLAACHLRFGWENNGSDANVSGNIISDSITMHDEDERQGSLFQETVTLDDRFFTALKGHSVPLSEEAIRQLSHSPMSLDTYTWLGYRLHALKKPTDVSWISLAAQFGSDYKAVRQFRADFQKAMAAACSAYPDAKVEPTDKGLRLHPSPPPISKITMLESA